MFCIPLSLQSTKLIQHLMESNKDTRNQLQQYVSRCADIVRKMPTTRLEDLHAAYPTAEDDLEQVQQELYLNECVILVAGMSSMMQSCKYMES